VGDYELLTRLGEGGMGVVHLARKPGGQRVALKVLRPHIVGDDEARRRLAREVSSLTRVKSRRVAEILDADPWGDIPYVATRYVPGLSLHDHTGEEGPIDGPDLVWFASCLAEALAAVHGVGVLHRDIKPSNILMEGRTPILIDFGLARVADDPRLTHTGWLLGTPGYLAPEILFGQDATTASDVHSWGATVAFAGTGRAPFGRGPSVAIMDRVRRGEHDLAGLDPRFGVSSRTPSTPSRATGPPSMSCANGSRPLDPTGPPRSLTTPSRSPWRWRRWPPQQTRPSSRRPPSDLSLVKTQVGAGPSTGPWTTPLRSHGRPGSCLRGPRNASKPRRPPRPPSAPRWAGWRRSAGA
jgi:serine/threonine protein kinase